MSDKKEGGAQQRTVSDRWWVDVGEKRREVQKRPSGPAGMSFFRTGEGFEQERARSALTDLNLKLLQEADPPEGGWSYLQLVGPPFPERELERIKALVALPPYARGAVIDSGRWIRLLVTATPIGARILELALGEAPSFDCWVDGEWVEEAVFEDADRAIKAFRKYIEEYLSPAAIERKRLLSNSTPTGRRLD